MIKYSVEDNKKLIKKYPWLLPHNVWTGKPIEDYDYSYTELDDMSDGWRIAFGDLLCEEIQTELEKYNFVDEYRIVELKSKYGSMRLYDNGYPQGSNIPDIIGKYSLLSEYICEICGDLDVPSTNGWITPICKECIKKLNYKNPEKYWDEIDKEQKPHTLPLQYKYFRWSKEKGDETVIIDISDTVTRIRKRYAERKNSE